MDAKPTIDAYIADFPEDAQAVMRHIREVIRAHAPDATERISYGIPTFWQGENIIHFGGAKRHVGLYPGSEAVILFADRLKTYPTSKGTIQFPLDQPIPYDLIAEITDYRVKAAAERQHAKKK